MTLFREPFDEPAHGVRAIPLYVKRDQVRVTLQHTSIFVGTFLNWLNCWSGDYQRIGTLVWQDALRTLGIAAEVTAL